MKLWVVLLGSGLCLFSRALGTTFQSPLRLSPSVGASGLLSFSIRVTEAPEVLFATGGRMVYALGEDGFAKRDEVVQQGSWGGSADLTSDSWGYAYVAYQAFGGSGAGGAGAGVSMRTNRGRLDGSFGDPVVISTHPSAREPKVRMGPDKQLRIFWIEDDPADGEPWVRVRREAGEDTVLFRAQRFDACYGEGGYLHLLTAADGSLFYHRISPSGEAFTSPIAQAPGEEIPVRLAARDGVVRALFLRDGVLWLATGSGDAFQQSRVSEREQTVICADMVLTRGGPYIAYSTGEEAFEAIEVARFILPRRLGAPFEGEAGALVQLRLGQDRHGYTYLVFVRGDELFFTTDGVPLALDFSAEPTKGEVPMQVRFRNLSAGDAREWLWDFGDGSVSVDRNPVHTYEGPGVFTVSLSGRGPWGDEAILREDLVTVAPKSSAIRIPVIDALPGDEGLQIPILISHRDPIEAFELGLVFDAPNVAVREFLRDRSELGRFMPDILSVAIDPAGTVVVGCVFAIHGSVEERRILPGEGQRLANLLVDVSPQAAPGHEAPIEPRDGVGTPAVANSFTVSTGIRWPLLYPGAVRIRAAGNPEPLRFIRGDVIMSGTVAVNDALAVLRWLFSVDPSLPCPDAADVDDSGAVNMADAILLLMLIFVPQPRYPPYPFPAPGLDPTPDAMGECREPVP